MAMPEGCSGSRGVSGGAAQEATSHRQHHRKCSWSMPCAEDTSTRWVCESGLCIGQKRRLIILERWIEKKALGLSTLAPGWNHDGTYLLAPAQVALYRPTRVGGLAHTFDFSRRLP